MRKAGLALLNVAGIYMVLCLPLALGLMSIMFVGLVARELIRG